MVSHKEDGLKEFQTPPQNMPCRNFKRMFLKIVFFPQGRKLYFFYNVCPDRIQGGAPKTNHNLIKGDSIKS